MSLLVVGGAGFVGFNVVEAALRSGRDVTIADRAPPPADAQALADAWPGRLSVERLDVTDAARLEEVAARGFEAIVLGAAVTADAAREASAPELILSVNLLSHVAALKGARRGGTRRVVNLSSAAAYGAAALGRDRLGEELPGEPAGLYGLTKLASEGVVRRLGTLWGLHTVSLRLSAVFGPWERATGVRDTLSPPFQVAEAIGAGRPALLARPGFRDWVYAPDVAEAVLAVADAPHLRHPVYNVSSPARWSMLDWGRALTDRQAGGGECRLVEPGEAPTIDLHGDTDRPPLATDRLRDELGWSARFGLAEAAAHYTAWRDARSRMIGDPG